MPSEGFEISTRAPGWTCLVTKLKGKTTQAASRLGSKRFLQRPMEEEQLGPLQLMRKWMSTRPDHELLFGLEGNSPDLNSAVKRTTHLIDQGAPRGCVFQSHSCRIAAYTESVLSGEVSPSILRAQFNWSSANMPRIYFDHRLIWTPDVSLFTSLLASREGRTGTTNAKTGA